MTDTSKMSGREFLAWIRQGMRSMGFPEDTRVERVEVPGVAVPLFVRTFSAEAWAALYRHEEANAGDRAGRLAWLLAFGVSDGDGHLVLTPETAATIPHDVAFALEEHVKKINQL